MLFHERRCVSVGLAAAFDFVEDPVFMPAGRLELCRRAHSYSHRQPRTWKGRNFSGTVFCFP